jgi:hypothetical protein
MSRDKLREMIDTFERPWYGGGASVLLLLVAGMPWTYALATLAWMVAVTCVVWAALSRERR